MGTVLLVFLALVAGGFYVWLVWREKHGGIIRR